MSASRFHRITVRMLRRLGLGVALVLAAAAAPALGAYAPIDEPGPPLDVPAAQLAAALTCTPGVTHATRAPVLLVPGSGSTPADEYTWNYEPALTHAGIPWCAVTLPESANGDIQTAGEYMVSAIRTMYGRAGRRIAIIGHSQGGMVGRWALRWWPDTRAMVDDLIGIAPSNNGSVLPHATCNSGCTPADSQQASGSNFLTALNTTQETFPGISYSVILSRFDEEAVPAGTLSGGGGQITNTYVQDICPNDHTEHLGLGTYDPVAYALAIDALSHAGPADPKDIPLSVCAQQFMPGVNPATFPTDAANAAYADETSPSPTVHSEPPLACYTAAACIGVSRESAPQRGWPPARAARTPPGAFAGSGPGYRGHGAGARPGCHRELRGPAGPDRRLRARGAAGSAHTGRALPADRRPGGL